MLHTYMHAYIHTYVRTYVRTYIYIYIHGHTHTHIYIYIYICIYSLSVTLQTQLDCLSAAFTCFQILQSVWCRTWYHLVSHLRCWGPGVRISGLRAPRTFMSQGSTTQTIECPSRHIGDSRLCLFIRSIYR